MAYDVPQLLAMSQAQLDDLFRSSPPGDIPNGPAKGTAIIAPGTTYSEPIAEELAPGPAVDTDAALADYVRSTAWGHHASGTCAIGPAKDGGVLGGDFAVHGTRGLRVVDASVFPRIPGLFIASAVYTVAEKAAATLLAEAAREPAAA